MTILRYMNILLASNNEHKKAEFSRLLVGHTIALPADLGLSFDFREDKETFTENALGKAMALATVAPPSWAVLADDSGLCVDALDGEPGVRTARYGQAATGRLLGSSERNQFLLRNLSSITEVEERSAQFVCDLALIINPHRIFTVCEEAVGYIAFESAGVGGFGYDPIFIVKEVGQTMASIADEEKDRYSHRGIATRRMIKILEDLRV